IFSLTAAKLLYFANKAYRLQALGLVEKAMASTTAVANAFAVAGQLQMWEGNINKAIELYAQGLKLTRHGSHFHRYFLVLIMHAELACGVKGSEAAEQLFLIVPDERALLSLLWAPELTTAVRTEIDALVKTMNASAARAIIQRQHYLVARHFRYQAHRHAIMGRPVALLRRHFSKEIIPHDVMADLPSNF